MEHIYSNEEYNIEKMTLLPSRTNLQYKNYIFNEKNKRLENFTFQNRFQRRTLYPFFCMKPIFDHQTDG